MWGLSRRCFLRAGVLGGLGLTLPGLLRHAQGAERSARARSAILIWLNGGLTQKFNGGGTAAQDNQLSGEVSVTVAAVLPNGVLSLLDRKGARA